MIEFAVLWATHARHATDPDRAYAESARLLTLANGVESGRDVRNVR